MRREPTVTAQEDNNIDMTPMLDVVFIMLIFFIVTSSFIKESGIQVKKPETETAVKKPRTSILIAISADSEVWIDRNQVEKDLVKVVLQRLYSENPKGTVVVQADQEADAEAVLGVMDAAREIGVADIAIAGLPKE